MFTIILRGSHAGWTEELDRKQISATSARAAVAEAIEDWELDDGDTIEIREG